MSSIDDREKITNIVFKDWENNLFKNFNIFEKMIQSESSNTTKNNHLGPCSHFYNFNKTKTKKDNRQNVSVFFKEGSKKLDKFMSKKYLLLQELENLLTKFPFQNKVYNTENIRLFEQLQKSIDLNLIDSLFYLLTVDKNDKKNPYRWQSTFDITNPYPDNAKFSSAYLVDQKRQLFNMGPININLFIHFFKARQILWRKIQKNPKMNILVYEIIQELIYLNTWTEHQEQIVKKLIVSWLHSQINSEYGIFPQDVLNNQTLEKIFHKDLDVSNNALVRVFLYEINKIILANNIDNSLVYQQIVSLYLYSLSMSFIDKQNEFSIAIVYLKENLKTKENPVLCYHMNKKEMLELVQDEFIDEEYLKNNEKTTIYMLALTPNLLLINSNSWFCDFMSLCHSAGKEDIIYEFYNELYNLEIKHTNDLEIITVSK